MYRPLYQEYFHYFEHELETPVPKQRDVLETVAFIKEYGVEALALVSSQIVSNYSIFKPNPADLA